MMALPVPSYRLVSFLAAFLAVTQLCLIVFFLGGTSNQDQDFQRAVADAVASSRRQKSTEDTLLATVPRATKLHHRSTEAPRLLPCLSNGKCEVIHLAFLSCGSADARNLAVLLKSILLRRTTPLQLHLFTNKVSQTILGELLRTWRLPEVLYTFYSVETLTVSINSSSYPVAKNLYLLKLGLPEILPIAVEQVLVFSGRLIINADLHELWLLFSYFKKSEGLAIVRTASQEEIMLMHLTNLRQAMWSQLWSAARRKLLKTTTEVRLNAQAVIDVLLREKGDLLVSLPCQWDGRRPDLDSRCTHGKRPKIIGFDEQRLPSMFWKAYLAVVNYDGALLRNDVTLSCHSRKNSSHADSSEDQLQHLMDMYDGMLCKEYFQELITIYRTHPFYLDYKPSTVPQGTIDIAIATQLSFDRISLLERLITLWPGPISAAIYIGDIDLRHLLAYVLSSKTFAGRKNIGLHLVFKEGSLYPTNYLRNVALRNVDASHVFLLDVDFMPTPDLYIRLKKAVVENRIDASQLAIVVPAFETDDPKLKFPKTKLELSSLLDSGIVYPFRFKVYPIGHGATNFTRWRHSDKPYQVPWKAGYEPYIVMNTAQTPPYNELFSGYGMNKIEHILEVTAKGYKMLILTDGFILHFPHSASFEKARVKNSLDIQRCKRMLAEDFARDLLMTYGEQSLGGWKPRPKPTKEARG